MQVERHQVARAELDEALEVPSRLGRDVRLAEYGGAYPIQSLSTKLIEYVAARSASTDPRIEEPETWLALETASDLASAYVTACLTPPGRIVDAWVEYLGVGFGFTVEDEHDYEPEPAAGPWLDAYRLALVRRDTERLSRLESTPPRAAEHHLAVEAGALIACRAGRPLPDDAPALLVAVADRDRARYDALLVEALEQHRTRASKLRELLAWELLAVAAVAHDAGLPCAVGSDYLPPRLITNAGPLAGDPTKPIARPPMDSGRAARWLEGKDRAAEAVKCFRPTIALGQHSGAFQDFGKQCLAELEFRSVLDPTVEDPRQWELLVLATQAMTAAFRLAVPPGGPQVQIVLGEHTGMVPASGPTYINSPWAYVTAVSLALITRDAGALAFLADVDDAVLDQARSRPVTRSHARALRARLSGGDPDPHIAAALRSATSDDHWIRLASGPVRLLDRLQAQDPDGFTAALAAGLDLYRQHYSAGSHRDDPDGQLSVDLLGLACLAHDLGWPIDVESDYLPRRLVENTASSNRSA